MFHSRNLGLKGWLVALLLVAIIVSAMPALAQGGVRVQTGYNLTLRGQPNRNSADLGTVPFNTELDATAISPDRNWVAVNYNGQGGWLTLQYTSVVSGRLGDLPVSNQTFTPGGGGGGVTSPVNVVTTINLRYRNNPTLDERPVGAIPYQTQVPALALSSDGLFVLVSYLGQNVWVWREYVQEVSGSLSQFTPGAPPIGAGAAPAPAAPSAPAGGTTTTTGRSGIFLAIEGTSGPHGWHYNLPGDLQARSFDTARIVGYIRETTEVVESCVYNIFINGQPAGQRTYNRVRYTFTVRLVDQVTGQQIDERGFAAGDPPICPASFTGSVTLESRPNIEQALNWFRERQFG